MVNFEQLCYISVKISAFIQEWSRGDIVLLLRMLCLFFAAEENAPMQQRTSYATSEQSSTISADVDGVDVEGSMSLFKEIGKKK